MELRTLKYFLEIAREGNFTRAADRLHITQPTLSRQIAQLEEDLGEKLYIRESYGIRLTEEGLLLKKRAEEILELEEKIRLENEITALKEQTEKLNTLKKGLEALSRAEADYSGAIKLYDEMQAVADKADTEYKAFNRAYLLEKRSK